MTMIDRGAWRRRLVALTFLLLFLAGGLVTWPDMAQAQTSDNSAAQSATAGAPDYDAWALLAERTEATLEADRASSSALESLRAQIVTFRQAFLAAQSTNKARIDTLRGQIAALGEPPAEGTNEPPEIAAQREELNAQLERLMAPVRRAEAAYTRADGLVAEIDGTIRERQADAIFSIGPSPLNPTNWPAALARLSTSLGAIWREVTNVLASDAQRAELRSNAPIVLGYLLVAIALLLRGRVWIARAASYVTSSTGRGSELWALLVSLGAIVLPLIGLYALTEAIFASGFAGLRGTFLLTYVPLWGAIILGARWLGDRIFSREEDQALFAMSPVQRAEARTYLTILALLYVARDVLAQIGAYDRYSDTVLVVLNAPILVLAGLILFRAGMLLRAVGRPPAPTGESDEPEAQPAAISEERALRSRTISFVARAAAVIGVVAPLLALIGYFTAAERLIYPAILTIGLLGLLLVLHTLVRATYRASTMRADADSLVPILINFALTVSSLPVLALIWGARVADLTELWARFRAGFQLGETRISPTDFLTFVLIFAIGYTITRVAQGALRSSVLPRTRIDTGGQNAIISGLGYLGIFLAAILAFTTAGIDLSSLALVAGALSVGIGFGLQNIVSNFISGIILLIERPVAEGDWIEVGSHMGIVKDISVRSTRIETFDRTDVIVPNADLISSSVINWTRGSQVGRVIVPVGVAYGTDTRRVEQILLEIARAHPMVLLNPAPAADFLGFGADALDFRIRAIIRDINWLVAVKNDLNHEIAKRFVEEGIEIPFAQRDIWIRNASDLAGLSEPGKTPKHLEDDDGGDAGHPIEGGTSGGEGS